MSARGVAFGLLAALVGVSALAFGSVEHWAGECLRLGLLIVAALLVAARDRPEIPKVTRAVLLPLLAVALFGWAQSETVPGWVIGAVSPRWNALRDGLVPAKSPEGLRALLTQRAIAAGVTPEPGAATPDLPPVPESVQGGHAISVAPETTRRAVLAWLTVALALGCAGVLATRPLDRYRLLWALALWSGVLGAIAVLTRVSGTSRLLWIRQAPLDDRFLGPFVNANHFAAFVEIGTLIAFGLILAILGGPDGPVTYASIRRAILDRAWALPRLVVLGTCAVLGLVGMALSRSRAGNLAFVLGLAALLAARRLKGRLVVAFVLAVCLGLAVGIVSWIGAENRAQGATPYKAASIDPSFSMRWDIWGRTIRIVKDFPVTGTGLGTFGYVYALYDRPGEWLVTDQAHNDYLQLLAETGIVGGLLLGWGLFVIATRVLRPVMSEKNRLRWTTAACVGAVIAISTHAVFEFGLQIPAVAVEFAVTLGILTAIASDPPTAVPEDVA